MQLFVHSDRSSPVFSAALLSGAPGCVVEESLFELLLREILQFAGSVRNVTFSAPSGTGQSKDGPLQPLLLRSRQPPLN